MRFRKKSKRKISIVNYLMRWWTVFFLLFSVFLIICVNVMADYAIRNAVIKEFTRQMYRAVDCVEKNDGKIEFSGNLENVDSDFTFVILDSHGNLVDGEYPPGYDPADDDSKKMHFRVVKSGNESFYVTERTKIIRRRKRIEGDYILRGIINKKNISTVFQRIKLYSYIALLVEVVMIVIVGIVLQRRISKPMLKMCEQAVQIGEGMDLSERMVYDGRFSEMDILLKAYNQLLVRMEDMISRQNQFNADVSHELKTPITVIRAQCQLTKDQLTAGQEVMVEEMIGIIERQSDWMGRMVEQLLALSRMDQNKISFELEEMDLADVVEVVCEDEGAASDKQRFDYDLSSTPVVADVALITMAVRNLISNAVKYSDKDTRIKVGCGRGNSGAYVSVQDFGIGIAPEDCSRIFEHYYRAEQSRSSEGFGLGLTLAMKIAEKHGGTIHVKSMPGEGSTFTLVIP